MKYTNFRLCPGHIRASGGSVCPDGTSYFRAPAIFVGHFRHRVSAEALVTGEGCEPHVNNFGGAFLFTRDASAWKAARYRHGVDADACEQMTGCVAIS